MGDEIYQHIFLGHEFYDRLDFISPRGGRGGRTIPHRNVQEHGPIIRKRLDKAWEDAKEIRERRRAVALPTRSGLYLEFRGDPGYDLVSKSLEDRRSGIRLLSVADRTVAGETDPVTFATVYVPADKKGHFLRKIKKYETEKTASGKPKNQPLIDSISDIRLALLSSFWHDTVEIPKDESVWCEAWIRVNEADSQDIENRFRDLARRLDIEVSEGSLEFPERTILRILANAEKLTGLLESSDHITEYRLAKETPSVWLDLSNLDQSQAVQELVERLEIVDTDVVVCILDTGINSGHPLIQHVLSPEDCHSVDQEWGIHDHHHHGTLMAGVSAFGDLQDALASGNSILITHRLESSKILPPNEPNPPHLYGFVTAQGISLAEIRAPNRKRIICLAVASSDDRDRGRPSSWSAEIDKLASGADDDTYRLLVIAAGNTIHPDEWSNYPQATITNEVHDPGQSWNALTVGAVTHKTNIQDPQFAEYSPIADAGSISPFTTTSLTWENKWPAKPDILLEGGNAADHENGDCFDLDDLSLLSTYYHPNIRQFACHNMTSAATALASRMAARLQAEYPDAWPETIRGLMVHSAEWTDGMKEQFLVNQTKSGYRNLLHVCGYGVPDFNRAMRCATDHLTLISQFEMQPYTLVGGRYRTQDMHIHELPWPRDVLLNLGEAQITLRVTLSYFIEPGPGQIGWRDRYRYASHGLRFDLITAGESREEFIARLNQAARVEGVIPQTSSDSDRWTIGSNARDRGSIHSDVWRGNAAEIASTNLVGIYPVIGWWRERYHLGRWNKRARYSLIVSLHSPEVDVDIYTPVATQIGIVAPIEIEVETTETDDS